MPNRRTKSRRREKILGMSNKVFFSLLTILMLIIITLTIGIAINNIKEKNKFEAEQKQKSNELEEIYENTNNHLNLTDNYRSNTIIRLAAVGDIFFDEKVEKNVSNYDSIFENVRKCFKDADITIGTYAANIENDKEEEFAKSVRKSGIELVSTCTEKNEENLKEKLEKCNFDTIGKNETDEETNNVKIIEKRGIKIALIAYTTDETKKSLNLYSEEKAKADLSFAKENAVVTIVMMNFKQTNDEKVSDDEKNIANFLVQNGADAIIGTSKSNIKKMEMIENKEGKKCIVAYSLGDYVTDFSKEQSKLQIILNIQIYVSTSDEVSIYKVDYTPVYMNDYGTKEKENRYKLFDVKYEIAKFDYEIENNKSKDEEETNNNIASKTTEEIIDEETYKKMKKASDKIKDIIQN